MTKNDLPEGVTITPGITVTIEDLTLIPPLRAFGNSEEEALAAYEYQRELRTRTDSEDRGPVVAQGVKMALPPDESGAPADGSETAESQSTQSGDLTPGQNAPADNPI